MSATESLILNEISQSLKKMVGDVYLVDNDDIKIQIIPMSFGNWHTPSDGNIILRHSIGEMPDNVIVLGSNLGLNSADDSGEYFENHRLISKIDRTFYRYNDVYGATYIEYYDYYSDKAEYREYSSEILTDNESKDFVTWDESSITIKPYGNIVFMPRSAEGYPTLGEYIVIAIKHKAVA